jgi:NitT/TauT family transport system ATP-binding protein
MAVEALKTVTSLPRAPKMELRSLSKTYDSVDNDRIDALLDINLDIGQGEFFSVVGPSGCGKSTLLKIVAGLLPVTQGAAFLNGNQIKGSSSDIGVVFQSPTLLEWRTVLQNVTLVADVQNRDHKKIRQRAVELIEMTGLSGFAGKYPSELSGGMQQRVAIARALVHAPSLLLMDEPFGALDAMTRDQMTLELQRIWLRQSVTVFFITHSIQEAVFLSDRVAVMSARPGRVLEIVAIDFARPRHLDITDSAPFGAYVGKIRKCLDVKTVAE